MTDVSFYMFLGVPGTIRAPRYTFYVYTVYTEIYAGHQKTGHHGLHFSRISIIRHHKKT